MKFEEITGDLIQLALEGKFDVIAHGCNCFCTMGAGIAPKMAKVWGVDTYEKESFIYKGDINKLGTIDWCTERPKKPYYVINCYTQYKYGRNHIDGDQNPLNYEALTLCMKKINHQFKGLHIGLPTIGCGLAGGIWDMFALSTKEIQSLPFGFKDVKQIMMEELKDMDVTVVHYK